MARNIDDIIKKLPKAQKARVNARAKELIDEENKRRADQGEQDRLADEIMAHGGAPVVDVGDISEPRYINIKKTIQTEESFNVLESDLTIDQIQTRLAEGDVNLVQVAVVESYVWVVDKTGARVALLEKSGGMGPDETVTIEVR